MGEGVVCPSGSLKTLLVPCVMLEDLLVVLHKDHETLKILHLGVELHGIFASPRVKQFHHGWVLALHFGIFVPPGHEFEADAREWIFRFVYNMNIGGGADATRAKRDLVRDEGVKGTGLHGARYDITEVEHLMGNRSAVGSDLESSFAPGDSLG